MMILRLVPFVLLLAACSGGGAQEVGIDSTTTLGSVEVTTTSESVEVTTTSESVDSTPVTGPSLAMMAFLFPISGAERQFAFTSLHAGNNEGFMAMGECLSEEGFDLDFKSEMPPDIVDRQNHLPAYGSLRKYGFGSFPMEGVPPGFLYTEGLHEVETGLSPLPEGVSMSEVKATLAAYESCREIILNRRPDRVELWGRPEVKSYFNLSEEFDTLVATADPFEPTLVAAFKEFNQCVMERGWVLRLTRDDGTQIEDDSAFFGALDGVTMAALDRGGVPAGRAAQIDAAADYADCMAPVEDVRQPIRKALRDEFIDENFALMIEIEEWFQLTTVDLDFG